MQPANYDIFGRSLVEEMSGMQVTAAGVSPNQEIRPLTLMRLFTSRLPMGLRRNPDGTSHSLEMALKQTLLSSSSSHPGSCLLYRSIVSNSHWTS